MLQIHTQRKVEFMKIERANAWVVVAFLVEYALDERKVVSGPKVVKVILKTANALPSGKKQALLALPAPVSTSFAVTAPIVSIYFPNTFGFSNSEFVISLAARPPTIF